MKVLVSREPFAPGCNVFCIFRRGLKTSAVRPRGSPGAREKRRGTSVRNVGPERRSGTSVGRNVGTSVGLSPSGPTEPGCDCDPTGQLAAYELLVDDLAQDRGQVEPAPGFDAAAWRFEGGAYRQDADLQEDRDDASFVVLDEPADDVLVEVTAASTGIVGDLRQVFVTARASSTGDDYEAVACGIELDLRDEREPTTSIGILSGPPSSVVTSQRTTREYDGVDIDQEFDIRMELAGDELTCQVTTDGETTFVQGGGFGGSAGAIGFHTRESNALYRDLRVCGLPSP